jgi:hypothetical protein
MNKHFFYELLCGVMFLLVGIGGFTSCNNDDVDDLKSRVSVIEVALDDIKAQLGNALMTGASITKVEEANGTYTLTLSDGQKIVIKPGGGSISVVVSDTEATITVDGEDYVLPLGSPVNSLIYSPETIDGTVQIGNDGATVNFLTRPALTSLDGASFSIAESHVLTRAVDGEQFRVNGDVKLEGGFLKVPIKALGEVEAGNTYAVSLQMNLKGTVIGSNFFNVKISDDFVAVAEDLGGVEINAAYSPKDLADGFKEMTIKGGELLKLTDFKVLFSTLPDNAEFAIAGQSKQPAGSAQDKYEILSKSLTRTGAWAFSQRPGTSFNDNTDRPGFLVNVLADDVVKAKIYVVINDEIAGLDFNGVLTQAEAEWGGRDKSLVMGAQTIDMQKTFANWEAEYPIIYNGQDTFFEHWGDYAVTTADQDNVVYNSGGKLVLGDLGKDYATGCRGVYWFYRGFAIYVPEALATTDGKYVASNGKSYSGAEGYDYDYWLGQYNEYIDNPTGFYASIASWNITIDEKTGVISLPATYTGYGLRLGVGAAYEYAYGVKRIGKDDQLGLFFFDRRLAPAGATMPDPKP